MDTPHPVDADDLRPDPDALLARVQQQEAQARRGRLKIFFGASAGVGKTYAMLSAAHAAQAQGGPLVVGLVETHGRAETEALLAGLPLLALKDMPYRDRVLKEFDLDAALAFGAAHAGAAEPPLVLLDELAHSNAPGSRHPKRWQDVEELLAAGIDVWSTMNVQHLESLNDVVGGITGIRVWETVPDTLFDAAEDVVVVDLPPDELLARLAAGKVYIPAQAQQAAANFFRKGNLIALRELALRRTADRVDTQMQDWRRAAQGGALGQPVWATRDALLACIGPGDGGEAVVRCTARLTTQSDLPWHAVFVDAQARQRVGQAA
ncbi:MAG: two-component system sensor histidine kinase KdbD, partial [Proteobacteria bacterium]|nr:two-component system sensor histidine kinase KdbD [Pseudomonadota bacterium]